MKERVEGFVAQFQEYELDGVLISAPENRRYLSGFSGSAGYLFITKANAVLVTDARYTEQATNQSPDFEVKQVRGGWGWLTDEMKSSGVKKLGFESQDMSVSAYNNLIETIKGDSSLGDVSMIPAPASLRCSRYTPTRPETVTISASATAPLSAAPAPESSRRPSARNAKPICSASKRFFVEVSPV